MIDNSIIKTQFLNLWTSLLENFSFPPHLEKYLIFIPFFIIGFLFSLLLTPIIGNFAKKHDVVYIPDTKRKGKDFDNSEKAMHKGVIPALGGLSVMIPFFLLVILCFKLDSITLPFLLALGILTVGGVLDDVLNLSAKTQMVLQILAVSIITFSILDLDSFPILNAAIPMDLLKFQPIIGTFTFSLIFPGDIFLFVWLLFCINSFKWIGGSPGLIEGNGLITIALIFIISVRYQVLFASTASSFLTGSLLAFLIFAYPPPLIMSGSSGKSVYGLLVCGLGLMSQTKFATTLILLLFPTLDAVYVLIKRYVEYKPKNLLTLIKISGTTHFHHQLLKLGLSRKNVFWIEILITLVIGSAVIVTTGAYRYLLIILGIVFTLFIILYTNFKAFKKEKDGNQKKESSESKYSY